MSVAVSKNVAKIGSLHQRILTEIEQNILSGKWMPGHRIPSENELADTYQCSRMTVNKVLSQLAQARMVERKRKSGTIVLRSQTRSAVLEIRDISAEVAALNLPYCYEILEHKKRRSLRADLKLLAINKPVPVSELLVLHFAASKPFCLEHRLINLEAVPTAAVEDYSDQPPGTWLRIHVPWTSAEHRIRAGAVDTQRATLLQVDIGTPSLIVERSTWILGKPVTHVRLTYPGESHELVARFSPTINAVKTEGKIS